MANFNEHALEMSIMELFEDEEIHLCQRRPDTQRKDGGSACGRPEAISL